MSHGFPHMFALFGLLATGGCSVNETGFVQTQTFQSDAAVTQRVQAFGLHLDTRDTDPSLTLGHYEGVRVYSTKCGSGPTPDVGHQRLSFSRVTGAQIKLGPNEASISLGRRDLLLVRPPPIDTADAIRFWPRKPEATSYSQTLINPCQPEEPFE